MSTAAWAVIGVFVGATLQFVAHLLSERRADRRAEADRLEARDAREEARDEARDARLFEARRAAYESFQATARSLIEVVWGWHVGELNGRPVPDYNYADALIRDLGRVRLYGSANTVRAAEELLHVVTEYGESDPADAPSVRAVNDAYQWADDALTAFAHAARRDMGATPGD